MDFEHLRFWLEIVLLACITLQVRRAAAPVKVAARTG
jgi:hypothetical protein